MRSPLTLFCTGLVLVGATAAADTLHVPEDHDTIQDAVNAAVDGDEILLGPGNWTLGFAPPSTPQVVDTLGKSLVIRSLEGPEKTSIDGEGHRRVITVSPNESAYVHLDGLTITGGETDLRGGGIYAQSTNLTITNCIITANESTEYGSGIASWSSNLVMRSCTVTGNAGIGSGGGLRCLGVGTATISNCTFTGNRTWYYSGGGIDFYGFTSGHITDCVITDNECASGFGGAISLRTGCNVDITNCTISGNHGGGGNGKGGGIACHYDCNSTITGCRIDNNTAGEDGGGLYIEDGCTVRLVDCEIKSNTAENGGGIECWGGSPLTLENCIVSGNTKTGLFGGGIHADYFVPAQLIDTVVCGNTPDQINGSWDAHGTTQVIDECPACAGDATGDGLVDVNDVLHVLSAWNTYDHDADFDEDGLVDIDDVLLVLARFGSLCP